MLEVIKNVEKTKESGGKSGTGLVWGPDAEMNMALQGFVVGGSRSDSCTERSERPEV